MSFRVGRLGTGFGRLGGGGKSVPRNPNLPLNTVPPTVTGTATEGQTLTKTGNGTWTGAATITFTQQWWRTMPDEAIPGAINTTYVLTATDVGREVYCKVRGTNAYGFDEANSNVLGPITATTDSAAATNFLARTSGLTTRYTDAYKALLNGLTTDGLFNADGTSSYFDGLWVYATKDATTARLNLVSSSYPATEGGSPVFTVDLGYKITIAAGPDYVATGLNSSTAGGLATSSALHFCVWDNGSVAQNNMLMGADDSYYHIYPNFSGSTYARISNGGGVVASNANVAGMYFCNRSNSTNCQVYRNASLLGSSTSQTVDSPLINAFWYAPYQSINPVLMCSVGASMNATQVTNFYNRMHTYLQTIALIP